MTEYNTSVKQGRRRSLNLKLNLLIVAIILALSTGLVLISYYVFCDRVSDQYEERMSRALADIEESQSPEMLTNFWNAASSDGYKEAYARAAEEEDETILIAWMESQPSAVNIAADEVSAETLDEEAQKWSDFMGGLGLTMHDDYEACVAMLRRARRLFDVTDACLQIEMDGIHYNIADAGGSVMKFGTVEEEIEEFEDYPDNPAISPTMYNPAGDNWVYTAMAPIEDEVTGEAVGLAVVDVDMTEIMSERHSFFLNSLVFIVLLTAGAIIVSSLLMNRMVIHPLSLLSNGAMGFAKEEGAFAEDDIISLSIRSNDEIGDLYREIRSMEGRIVSNTENLTRVTAERERVGTELRTAARIQASMLPDDFPAFPGREEFDLYASMDPAKEVGGDFYDFFLVDDTHLALLIADVSGKGVPAALFMMACRILLNYRTRQGGTPAQILADVNRAICRDSSASTMFVTVWMGILDVETGLMTCANAGHEYPVLRGPDGVFRVMRDRHGVVVGVFEQSKYTDYEVHLQPGDAVFVYTDGVPEANNAAGDFYGMERLEAALNRTRGLDPEGILRLMRSDVDDFTGDANQFDDLTMLCLEYKGPA